MAPLTVTSLIVILPPITSLPTIPLLDSEIGPWLELLLSLGGGVSVRSRRPASLLGSRVFLFLSS